MIIITFIISAAVIIIDQVSKYYIKNNMDVGESFNFIENILNIYYIENPGASFGMFANHRWIFMFFSTVALVLMLGAIFYFNKKSLKKYNKLFSVALAMIFGGGAGNMIDRIFNYGMEGGRYEGINVVVDFLEFDFVDFAVFNLADTFITMGSALFCICVFSGKYKLNDKSKEEIYEMIYEDGCGGIVEEGKDGGTEN